MSVLITVQLLVRLTLTPSHCSPRLYSRQDRISVASSHNGREAADARGCARGGDVRASITRYRQIFFCCATRAMLF